MPFSGQGCGFRVNADRHFGRLVDDHTGETCEWDYTTTPLVGYGRGTGAATAGWLAALPIFEPHWQVLMAHGRSSGHITWRGQRYDFVDAPAYVEKNWGGSFPMKWWWIQCNDWVLELATPPTERPQTLRSPTRWSDVALTAAGGRRGLLLPGLVEDVGMVAVHARDQATGEWHFFEFVPWRGPITWEVHPWRSSRDGGFWKITATNRQDKLEVELIARTSDEGSDLRTPTEESGMEFFCKDAYAAPATLKIWVLNGKERGELLLEVSTSSCGVEVGGGPWWTQWKHRAEMPRAAAWLLGLRLDSGLAWAKRILPLKVLGL